VVWGKERILLEAEVFIDASEDGRLLGLASSAFTVGRGDWPEEFLPPEERGKPLQQAATLMFKVRGVKPGFYKDMFFHQEKGVWGAYGGRETYGKDPEVVSFNNRWGPRGFALKPLNAAQDGPGSQEWWVNCLLIFSVDGRVYGRDREKGLLPLDGCRDVDRAWQEARELLEREEFIAALRRFPGFQEAEISKG